MPLYEYQCEACGVRFERRQHVNDEPVKVCPECGGAVHRLIQPVGIIFKGSGFYVTDNRAKSPTSKPGSKKTEKQSETSTESKSTDTSSTETSTDQASGD